MIGNVGGTSCWTDNFSNTYTQIGIEQNNSGQGIRCNLYACANGAGGAGHQWTQVFADRFSPMACYAFEVTGAALSGILDVVAQGNTGATFNFPVTTTNANDLVVSIFRGNSASGVITANGSFTLLDSAANTMTTGVMTRIVSATGTYDPAPTITLNSATCWITASFKEASTIAIPAPMIYQRKVLYFI